MQKKLLNSIFTIHGFIQKPEALFLYTMADRVKRNGIIVELGSFKGRSTVVLGIAAKKRNAKVYAVDTFKGDRSTGKQNTLDECKRNIRILKLSHTVLIKKGTTKNVALKWEKPIDFLFIDALHTYKAVKEDFVNWERFVVHNGIIAFHDSLLHNPVRRVFENYVLQSNRFTITGYQESIIAVQKTKPLHAFGVLKNYFHYYVRDIKHAMYEIMWPIRKTASVLGIYHEKEY